ncbi:putative nuclease HARBI1 [Dendronephthya gigantea]|uniref:putative nuclease HARBI1 n=1 Tax=Dendronephthya gigantea TaxID=151771 RepID=UPI00106B2CF8|nr:putative nuclease HARBI1 [Dendronephthya gigantea]
MSGKLHLPSDHSQTALTLEVVAEFEWSMSVGHTSLEPHSNKVVINNMANLWLERLQQLDNLQRNNGKENRNYYFNYEIYDEEQFRSRFRLTKDGFREMFDIIQIYLLIRHNERGNTIPAEIKLLLTLRYYATGTFQEACADLCDISQPSASRIIKRVSDAIARLKVHYIKFPAVEMLHQTKLEFWRICSFLNVVGKYRTSLCGGQAGSVHDSRIFDNSRLCAQFECGDIQGMLLGDNGYPCRPYLMTPIADPQTPPERRYNVSHIRTRNTVERMFGVWKMLFPCLSMSIKTKLSTTLTIIVATPVLHNFIRRRNNPIEEENLEDPENPLPAMNTRPNPWETQHVVLS